MSNAVIEVEGLSKRYRIGSRQATHETLGGAVAGFVTKPVRNLRRLRSLSKFNGHGAEEDVIWAVKDVSFQVGMGERIGIIGRNGAGKTTLLKILSRITEPTSGRVITRGRVSSLLEAGTGFHPELTGRENIYLNGAILGMSRREITAKFDEIVDFSGVEKFINTPVKRYSSGMQVRLAFSVAAHLEPEILLVDEVLAVGDAEFQQKCLGKMENVAGQGRTVIFVSHNMGAVLRLVGRCILMEDGSISKVGEPREVIDAYLERNVSSAEGEIEYPEDETKAAQVVRMAIRDSEGRATSVLDPSDDIKVDLDFVVRDPGRGKIDVLVVLALADGTMISSFNTRDASGSPTRWQTGHYGLQVTFPGGVLNSGRYRVRGVVALNGKAHDNHPQWGEGLNLELTDVTESGALGYGMSRANTLLAIEPQHTLSRHREGVARHVRPASLVNIDGTE